MLSNQQKSIMISSFLPMTTSMMSQLRPAKPAFGYNKLNYDHCYFKTDTAKNCPQNKKNLLGQMYCWNSTQTQRIQNKLFKESPLSELIRQDRSEQIIPNLIKSVFAATVFDKLSDITMSVFENMSCVVGTSFEYNLEEIVESIPSQCEFESAFPEKFMSSNLSHSMSKKEYYPQSCVLQKSKSTKDNAIDKKLAVDKSKSKKMDDELEDCVKSFSKTDCISTNPEMTEFSKETITGKGNSTSHYKHSYDRKSDNVPHFNMYAQKSARTSSSCSNNNSKRKDLTSVLFDRKNISKKGRPSSKKQKKRMREKEKQTEKKLTINVTQKSENKLGENSTCHFCGFDIILNDSCRHQASPILNSQRDSSSQNCKYSSSNKSESQGTEIKLGNFAAQFFLLGSDEDLSSDFEDDNGEDWFSDDDSIHCISANVSSIHIQMQILETVSETTTNSCKQTDAHHLSSNFSGDSCLSSFSPNANDSDEDDLNLYEDFFDTERTYPKDFFIKLNTRWNKVYDFDDWGKHEESFQSNPCGISSNKTQVQFVDDSELVTVYFIEPEYRMWLDRERFKRRINSCSDIISPVLSQAHREKIFQSIYQN